MSQIFVITFLQMYGKYCKVMSSRSKTESETATTFGFATPKKNSMIEMTNRILSSTKKTPVTKALDRITPSKSRRSISAPTTPTSSPKGQTPLKRLKLDGEGGETPKVVRKRISREIEKKIQPDSGQEESEDEDDSDSTDDEIKPLKNDTVKRTIFPKKSVSSSLNTDDYFERQASNHVVTSDKTLNQLRTPRLSPEVLKQVLDGEPLKYEKEIFQLSTEHQSQFSKWFHLLNEDFNVVLYGLGSKRNLLNDFHSEKLNAKDCIVINGFFPSLTMKNVLTAILFDILEFKGNIGTSISEQAECIMKAYNDGVENEPIEDDLYLIIHNIDGPMLRNDVSQTILSNLAAHPRIHLICSIDHINSPLLWDQNKLAKFNFIWHDATTFLPYSEETLNENSLMVRSSGSGLALNSLLRVFESLTPNAKEIYLLIIKYQMKTVQEVGFSFYQGISFKDLYRYELLYIDSFYGSIIAFRSNQFEKIGYTYLFLHAFRQCRPAFLVNSDLTLRAQLTEFLDHKLILSKKGTDGMDYLTIPLENPTLEEFLDKYKTTSL